MKVGFGSFMFACDFMELILNPIRMLHSRSLVLLLLYAIMLEPILTLYLGFKHPGSEIFFPIKAPVKLKKDDEVALHFWRVNNAKQVWYEWTISSPVALPIHNPNGRSYTIGL